MDSYTNMDRLIHLDLKSCPLKVDYLKKLFKLIKNWGGTGILIEWEDTFPYRGELTDIGSLINGPAYSHEEVVDILNAAKSENLNVIPLIQTFGHLEFVLKTKKWRSLREVPKYASSICPSHPATFSLVASMIAQIMDVQPDTRFLHIGGDEVWHLGICETCKSQNKQYLFLKHISAVLEFVTKNYAGVTPIMWDDMLRNIDPTILKEFNIGAFVEPMIWEYRRGETFSLGPDLWDKYSYIFPRIWIASAFKGAVGSCQISSVVGHYLSNHEKWLTVVAELRDRFIVRGITFTGWSRYDHFATLCELMPSGLVSLALCLRTWLNGKYENRIYEEISHKLGFTNEIPLVLYPINRPIPISQYLDFPGYQIHNGVEWFENIRAKFNFVAYSDQAVTWLNSWNVKRNHTSAMQVEHIVIGFRSLLNEIIAVEQHLRTCMGEAYYEPTIDEWLGCYLHPLRDKLCELVTNAESQLAFD